MRAVSSRSTNILEHAEALASLTRNRNGTITLTHDVTSTTVTDPTLTPNSVILFDPTTSHAAVELAAGTMFVSSRLTGSFVIAHANNAQTDRTFRWIAGGD